MPLDRFVLIIVCVVAAAAGTIYIGAALLASTQMQPLMGIFVLAAIVVTLYVGWRVIAERLQNKDDDHYDQYKH